MPFTPGRRRMQHTRAPRLRARSPCVLRAGAATMRAIVVHGGAGREAPEERDPSRAGVLAAAEAGWAVLARGGDALEAVVEAVALLENDPRFNAGLGSVLTVEGVVEMDASLMRGDTLAAGAVGAVSGIRNPIRV